MVVATATIPMMAGQLIGASLLGVLAFFFLLPRPRGQSLALGTFFGLASLAMLFTLLFLQFGQPSSDDVAALLFWLFACVALIFAGVLVAESNPARGAMAFAFVILSTCGLFLVLAAPFLMAATIIVYAGAIIVTFLFVLMLSHVEGPSDENDRSREPLLGALAGIAFAGLILFALLSPGSGLAASQNGVLPAKVSHHPLFIPPITPSERQLLLEVAAELQKAEQMDRDQLLASDYTQATRDQLERLLGGIPDAAATDALTWQQRLALTRADPRMRAIIARVDRVRDLTRETFDQVDVALIDEMPPNLDRARSALKSLRQEILILAGVGELPSRNVGTIGFRLFSEHLMAVELAGVLLLVATIGAVLIAGRRGRIA